MDYLLHKLLLYKIVWVIIVLYSCCTHTMILILYFVSMIFMRLMNFLILCRSLRKSESQYSFKSILVDTLYSIPCHRVFLRYLITFKSARRSQIYFARFLFEVWNDFLTVLLLMQFLFHCYMWWCRQYIPLNKLGFDLFSGKERIVKFHLFESDLYNCAS